MRAGFYDRGMVGILVLGLVLAAVVAGYLAGAAVPIWLIAAIASLCVIAGVLAWRAQNDRT